MATTCSACGSVKEDLTHATHSAVTPLIDELASLVHEMNDAFGNVIADFGSAIRELKRSTNVNRDKFDVVEKNMQKWENDLAVIKRKLDTDSPGENGSEPALKRIRRLLENGSCAHSGDRTDVSQMSDAQVQTVSR